MEEIAEYNVPPIPPAMQTPDIGKLAEALAKAQSEMFAAKKDGKNPFFKSDYATLHSCLSAGNPPLNKHGLSVTQLPGSLDGFVFVETILMHSSGQWIKSRLSVKPQKTDPQALGICISYLRRYSYSAIIGQSAADDDGESTMDRTTSKTEKAKPSETKSQKKAEKKAEKPADTFTTDMREKYKTLGNDLFLECLKDNGIGSLDAMAKIKDPVLQKKVATAMQFLADSTADKS